MKRIVKKRRVIPIEPERRIAEKALCEINSLLGNCIIDTKDGTDIILAAIAESQEPLHAEIVKLRLALNRIAYPKSYCVEGIDPQEIARRALVIGMKVPPLPTQAPK